MQIGSGLGSCRVKGLMVGTEVCFHTTGNIQGESERESDGPGEGQKTELA